MAKRKGPKKLSDNERAERGLRRAAEQIRRSDRGREFLELARSGCQATSSDIEKAGFTPARTPDGDLIVVPNVWHAGPVRVLQKLTITDLETGEPLAKIDFAGVGVAEIDESFRFPPVFLDLSSNWSEISSILREHFTQFQETAIKHGLVERPSREVRKHDREILEALDAHSRLTDSSNGIEPSMAALGRELRVAASTAKRRITRGREIYSDLDQVELKALISEHLKDLQSGNSVSRSRDVELRDNDCVDEDDFEFEYDD